MPVSLHFFRDAEASALQVDRCQLDRAILIAHAMKRIREDIGGSPSSGQEPSA